MVCCSLVFFSLLAAVSSSIAKVSIFNWYNDLKNFELSNKNLSSKLYTESDRILIMCRSEIPARIHLQSTARGCTNGSPPIYFCPVGSSEVRSISLREYADGDYYLTSFSTREDDGKDEREGGFCSEGLKKKVTIVKGRDPHWNEEREETDLNSQMFQSNAPQKERERKKQVMKELNLQEVNVARQAYLISHHIQDDDGKVFDADDEEEEVVAVVLSTAVFLPSTSSPPQETSGGGHPLRFIVCGTLVATVAFGFYFYYRRKHASQGEYPAGYIYDNLNHQLSMTDFERSSPP